MIPIQDFQNFLMAQPSQRQIRMTESYDCDAMDNETCGCILIQFGRVRGIDRGFMASWRGFRVDGYEVLIGENKEREKIENFIRECCRSLVINYDEAREIWKKLDENT